ncbi:MAG: hypothetical protein HBSAPP03_12320 [Phycisphaerae bacterium]|nr:MAG: hypothetical protein HBSAPP03_12320 [Phycisphaerae bacterium]
MLALLTLAVLAQVRPVPMQDVTLADQFWTPRQAINAGATLDHVLSQCESTGRIANLRRAGEHGTEGKGGYQGLFFNDSDVFKAVEGASLVYAQTQDKAVKRRLDELVGVIARAQQPDGYLNAYFTLEKPTERWSNLKDMHELYCAGHLFEAAVAHHAATGEPDLLTVATRLADHIDRVFGPSPKRAGVCGHPEIELALLRLWEHTGQMRYLDLARHFIHARGNVAMGQRDLFGEYAQDHKPLVDQDKAVGHAVRATYLYAAATRLAAIDGDEALGLAMDRLWDNLTQRKMYVTGGIGNSSSNEGFTRDFDLPLTSAYAETCAAIGLVQWAAQMNLLRDDAHYADILELALYNAVLSGVSADGRAFCYVNPISSAGQVRRQPWYDCACCPPNILRTIAGVGGYVATQAPGQISINLYAAGSIRATPGNAPVRLDVATRYPWDGIVTIRVRPAAAQRFTLRLRIPAWADRPTLSASFGGLKYSTRRGYLEIDRTWNPGDEMTLTLPMRPRVLVADPRFEDMRGRVALARGPLVYCIENADHPAGVHALVLNAGRGITERWSEAGERGPTPLLWLEAWGNTARADPNADSPYRAVSRGDEVYIRAMPYFAWGNRGDGGMSVWIAATESVAAAAQSGPAFSSSHLFSRDSLDALTDGLADDDPKTPRATWWPRTGTSEWVQVTFPSPRVVTGARLWWFDDSARGGGCSTPASWHLEYRDGDAWKPCEALPGTTYGLESGAFNAVRVKPVTTTAVRVSVTLRNARSAGITELSIDARRP